MDDAGPRSGPASGSTSQPTFRRGDHGLAVDQIIDLLSDMGLLEGDRPTAYDDRVEVAVRTFQQERGLHVDGTVGPATFRRMDEARWSLGDRILTHLPGSLMAGDDVYVLQQRLLELGFRVGRVDGIFGHETEAGLREFQRNFGIPADGTAGPATLKALARLRPLVSGGAPNALRAQERIREAGPQLRGKVVVVDPAPVLLPGEYTREAIAIVHDLAERIEGRLVATGVQAYLTVPRPDRRSPSTTSDATSGASDVGSGSDRGGDVDDATRAAFANDANADLCISLAVDASDNGDASGLATYFFGSETHDVRSTAGERLASLVQREVVARTDLLDLRTHPKAWDLLRRTRMPAVRMELGYLSNPGDAARLADPSFRDVLAEAVVVAVQRFYLSPEADAHTGFLRFSELRAGLAELDRPAPDAPG